MAIRMGAGCVKFGFGKNEDPPAFTSSSKNARSPHGSSSAPSRQRSLMTATVGRGACAANDCAAIKQNECDLSKLMEIAKDKTVVFIFGGPGSKKGCIVENLMTTYGFHLISSEDVIIHDLPRISEKEKSSLNNESLETSTAVTAVDDVGNSTAPEDCHSLTYNNDGIFKVKKILRDTPDHLTLDWMLDHLTMEINRHQSHPHLLIDLLPNFQFMLEAASFAPENCANQLEAFEQKTPSLFALYLDACHQLHNMQPTSVPRSSVSQCLCPEDNTEAEIKSEIDAAKMQLRHSTFIQVVKAYLDYFRNKMRLVTLDTSRASPDHMWFHVNELFETLNFKPMGSVNPTVVFATGNHDINIQPEKSYTILRLLPQEYYSNEQHLLKDICIETQKAMVSSKPLVVICHVANTLQLDAEHPSEEKCIKYLEKEDEFTRLELKLGSHCDMKNEGSDFKAISTPGNVVCFFPRRMEDVICRQVAAHVSRIIQKNLNTSYT